MTSHLRQSAAMVCELVAREHLAGRIVRRVEDDRFRLVVEGGGELVGIERPVGLPARHRLVQRDVARRRAGQDRVRPVVLVERLEDDHLVARIDDRHHRRHHRFGGAAADRDLLVGRRPSRRSGGRTRAAIASRSDRVPQVTAY